MKKDIVITENQDDLSLAKSLGQDLSYIEKLPNECIRGILGQIGLDKETLYNLLFVNKYFFNEAAKILYGKITRQFLGINTERNYNKRRQVAYVSFLQERVKEVMSSSRDDRLPSQIIGEVLGKFNLELSVPYRPCGISLLQYLYGSERIHCDIECDPNTFSLLTTDYSKLFTEMGEHEMRIGASLLSNRKIPESTNITKDDTVAVVENSLTGNVEHDIGNPTQGNNPNFVEDQVQTQVENQISLEDSVLQFAISEMWIYYNHDYLTHIAIDSRQSNKILQYATKLPSLDTMFLKRHRGFNDSHLEDIISFIRHNRSSFPKKKSLHIIFGSGWYCIPYEWKGNTMNMSTYTSLLKKFRDSNTIHMRPMLMILEAVRRPRILDLTFIPNFYSHAQNIETDRLLTIIDADPCRFQAGEGEAMGKFLLRCSNLQSLSLTVEDHKAFSWTAQNDQTIPSEHSHMKLEELNLTWNYSFYSAVVAFNEGLAAFAPSLKKASLECVYGYETLEIPIIAKLALISKSNQLQHLTSAHMIGNFSFLLPNLVELSINLQNSLNMSIGSLDNCPNLEKLSIDLTEKGELHNEIGPFQFGLINLNLFPKWNLPKLQHLFLKGVAAMRFDFESLHTMQSLQLLFVDAYIHYYSKEETAQYLARQHKLPLSSLISSSGNDTPQQSNIFGSYPFQKWSLPHLTGISLSGPPSAMFCLEHLLAFPGLRHINLAYFDIGWIKHPMKLSRGPISASSSSDTGVFTQVSDTPFMESRLEQFHLWGDWEMLSADLTRLLTVYAPFLKLLGFTDFQCHGKEGGYHILEAINRADEENSVYASRNNPGDETQPPSTNIEKEKQPGRQLVSVHTSQDITDKVMQDLGMMEIDDDDKNICLARHVRIYEVKKRILVRSKDFEQIEKERKKENEWLQV
ncbi:hypothetical protein BGZ76_002630 [Entomortierella beljakovae]|nr:hypothetical protein BGZ76_002630 [Entomortierella beljakovae]